MPVIEETLILKALLKSDDYFTRVIPYIQDNLFSEKTTKLLFGCIRVYYEKYNARPSYAVLDLFTEKVTGVTDDQRKEIIRICTYIKEPEDISIEWVTDKTLEWIRERSFFNAVVEGAAKFDKGELDTTLPEKLDAALSITFDNTVGTEFSEAEKRWELYTSEEEHIPFDLDIFNKITNGGVCRGTLNMFLSSDTGGFKSGTMCHIASGALRSGYNVLYVSLEMSEDKIMERIDANLLDIEIDKIVDLGKSGFCDRIGSIASKTQGRLIVKQFPTSQCHTGHIRRLLKDLKQQRNFEPDILFLDYINIMASARLRSSDAGNSYGYIKAISEEIRGLAIEYNIPVFSATQSNRGGSGNEELAITDISESYATVFVCDLVIGIITTETFDEQNKICFKQLKNRYRDPKMNNKFLLSVNKAKMKLYDIDVANGFSLSDCSDNNINDADESEFRAIFGNPKRKKINL